MNEIEERKRLYHEKVARIIAERKQQRAERRAKIAELHPQPELPTKKEEIKQLSKIKTPKPEKKEIKPVEKKTTLAIVPDKNGLSVKNVVIQDTIKTGRWKGETVCVIASGPSLTKEDCDEVQRRGWKTIAINDTYKMAPFAEVMYACDGSWWNVYAEEVKKNFKGEMWTQDKNAAQKYNLFYVKSENKQGLSLQNVIYQGANSGYQCTNLAYLWGANRIILLGLDCSPDAKGKTHWFGNHPKTLSNAHPFERWKSAFNKMSTDLTTQGVEVINASRRTALTCFTRKFLEDID